MVKAGVTVAMTKPKTSLEWHDIISSKKRKAKIMPSVDKIIKTIFWDTERYMLVIFCLEGNHQCCLLCSDSPETEM
jgi:hypothetical protein